MNKTTKFKKLVGATVSFVVDTPTSHEGDVTQLAIVKILDVKKAQGGTWYVHGLSLKRMTSYHDIPYRQFAIDRIENGTIAIIGDNDWTKTQPQLRRLCDSGFPKIELVSSPMVVQSFKPLKSKKKK